MPGILPMKVIKVGVNSQSRIAQACDRCRSKKIRCDGIRPCCSQCANVGFECKTSDKLSRRAFPRGYTESLEERVRGLEAEVRELKDLLDEKDEKIDMLSRIHSQSSVAIQLPSPRQPSSIFIDPNSRKADYSSKDEVFKVQQSPYLLSGNGSDSYFAGTSTVRTYIEAFKQRVQEGGRSAAHIDTGALLCGSLHKTLDAPITPASPVVWKAPPRLVSDQLINIYFQEWAPLFPVIHRPTFLKLYEKYVSDPDSVGELVEVAQLNLVFGIAAMSSGVRSSPDLDSFESQWKAALDSTMAESSMSNLQALVLAQLFCIQQGDYTRLLTYKGLSTTMSARLGLHQSQKRFALGTLTCETRKKVFWTLYTIDSFTAAILGLPKHFKDDDAQCEYPVDADDEYVTEQGFQPTLPGESTKLSSALALFRASRIMSKVLEEVFPAKASYELSLKTLNRLSDELDAWCNNLAPHLRLQFIQDKPSTHVVSSRSPLLSLAYQYIRALIHRPAISASLGGRSSSSMIAMASACKRVVQIVQLLDERGLSFSFCLNRDEVLVLAGFGLLFQSLGLDPNSRILKDNAKMTNAITDILSKSSAPSASSFETVTSHFLPVRRDTRFRMPSISRQDPSGMSMSSMSDVNLTMSTRKQLKAIASRLAAASAPRNSVDIGRRSTVPPIDTNACSTSTQSQTGFSPSYDPASGSRSEPARSPVNMYNRPTSTTVGPLASPAQSKPMKHVDLQKLPNLDYLSFGVEPEADEAAGLSQPVKAEPAPTNWEKLLGSLDNGETNIYDACYGGPPVDALLDAPLPETQNISATSGMSAGDSRWNSDALTVYQTLTNASSSSAPVSHGATGSIISFSTDEGLSSGDEFPADWASASSSNKDDEVRGVVLPDLGCDMTKFGKDLDSTLYTLVGFPD